MRAFKFRASFQGAHVQLLVYVGPDLDHLVFSGKLMFNPDEYDNFCLGVLKDHHLNLLSPNVLEHEWTEIV